MPEPTLSLSLDELEMAVGRYLGFGRGAKFSDTPWSVSQQSSITDCIRSGLRKFYTPPRLPGESEVHDWSFLRPFADLTLASGETTIALPDDFTGGEDRVVINGGTSSLGYSLPIVSVGEVFARQQAGGTTTGRPQLVSQEPLKGTTHTQGQRWQLRVWPAADAAYTISIQYYIAPNMISPELPYPLGGSQHAETIKQSCVAAAELDLDNELGVQNTLFLQCLAASVAADRKGKPQRIGRNLDRSDGPENVRQARGLVYVNGVLYD